MTGGQTATGGTFTITAPVAPPPAAPTVSGYQNTGGAWITSALPGTTVLIIGTNLGTSGTVKFNGASASTTVWTAAAITATVPSASSYPSSGAVLVTTGGQSASGSTFTITAPPATAGTRNVRNYGATGNGSTDDRAAIQKALDAALPGDAVYFPAGTYHISGSIDVHTSNVRVLRRRLRLDHLGRHHAGRSGSRLQLWNNERSSVRHASFRRPSRV